MRVPMAVESEVGGAVVLDCQYAMAEHEKRGLVVQWHLNDHPVPVYQWIPGKRPQDNGPLKGRLDLEYRADEDPYHRHRALHILKPSVEMGGKYSCKVSTFDNEDRATSVMVVYGTLPSSPITPPPPPVNAGRLAGRLAGRGTAARCRVYRHPDWTGRTGRSAGRLAGRRVRYVALDKDGVDNRSISMSRIDTRC